MYSKDFDLGQFSQENSWFLEEVGRIAGLGFWLWDLAGRTCSWTKAVKDVLGFDHLGDDRDLPEAWAGIIHPDDRKSAADFFSYLAATGQGDTTLRMVWPDGTFKVVRLAASKSSAPGLASPTKLFGILQDLTGLQAAQTLWRYALEGSGDGVYDWEIPSGKVTFSDGWAKMYGYEPSEISSDVKEWESRLHPDDLENVAQVLGNYLSGKTTEYRARYRMRCKDGSYKWTLARGKVMAWSADGRPQRMIGTQADIQEWRELEDRLLARDQDYDRLLTSYPGIIYRYSLAEGGLFYSGKTREILGYDPEWLAEHPQHWKESIHPEDLARVQAAFEAFQSGVAFDLEYRVQHRDSTWRWINDRSLQPLPGARSGIIEGVVVEITEKKRLAEISRRTDRLESLSVLSAGIAHDFNNLLAGIFGFLQLAQLSTPGDSKAAGYLEKSIGIISRAQGLTHQLMTFAKGGAPKKTLLNIEKVLRENISFTLSGSKVDFQIRIPEGLWLCDGDELQLGQVFDNLALNAVQAMPGGGRLVVEGRNRLEDGVRRVEISFADTGVGIPAENMARIFDPFFTTKKTGHGLGLATCYSIIQRHDGELTVSSEVGIGTKFTVLLPAVEGRVSEAGREASKIHSGSGRILVLDDQIFLLEVLKDLLASLGYSTELCNTESQLMDVFRGSLQRGEGFAAVFLDLTIPGGQGGVKVGELLHQLDPEVLLVAVSGYANDPVMSDPAAFGFRATLAKPFTLKGLHELFNTIFPKSLQNENI